ncbi:MAG TPA: hypothetical protein VNY05_43855 [Candidatus Acidoferrales bacterium]|jgi:mannonate dehydratase|nr:hypothetical protein [Candidatus Acidoferrales bacterium]
MLADPGKEIYDVIRNFGSRQKILLMPDPAPVAPNDPGGLQSYALAYVYIRALIQSVDQTG